MALFMGAGFVTFLSGIGVYGGALDLYRTIYPFVFFTALSLFPLFYIYIYQIVKPGKISRILLLHFIPSILLFSLAAIFYGLLMTEAEKAYFINEILLSDFPSNAPSSFKFNLMHEVDRLAKISYIILSVIYYIMTYQLVNKHQERIEDYYSALKGVSLNWVKTLAVFFILALLSGIAVHFFHRLDVLENQFLSTIPFVFLGTFFAIVGNYSNRQNIIIFPSERIEPDPTEDTIIKKEIPGKNGDDRATDVPGIIYPELKAKLEKYFDEYKPYLNPELKIWDIARDLNTNRTYISRLINHDYGIRFSTLVNKYRIEEARRLMSNPKTCNYSLSVIASMSGFLNYSSFVRAFRYFEKITPNKFLQSSRDFE